MFSKHPQVRNVLLIALFVLPVCGLFFLLEIGAGSQVVTAAQPGPAQPQQELPPAAAAEDRAPQAALAAAVDPRPLYLQLPFLVGQTWQASGGIWGPERESWSQHKEAQGGAVDFQPFGTGCGDDKATDDSKSWDCSQAFDNSLYPVAAAAAGNVTEISTNAVTINHGNFSTYYWHLEQVSVTIGQSVTANQPIALIADTEVEAEIAINGSSYIAYGPHLHFHIRPTNGVSADEYMLGTYLSGYLLGYIPGTIGHDKTTFTKNGQTVYVSEDKLSSEYQPFWDVPYNSTFFADTRLLACREVSSGYSDGSYQPDANITRGEIAKLLARAAADDVVTEQGGSVFGTPWEGPFPDTPNTRFHTYIRYLAKDPGDPDAAYNTLSKAVIQGKSDGLYHPEQNLTRGELASLVGRLYEAKGSFCADGSSPFPDVAEDSTHEKYITCLSRLNLIDGYRDGTFRPDRSVTRGEAARFVNGLIGLTSPLTPLCSGPGFALQVESATQSAISPASPAQPAIDTAGMPPGAAFAAFTAQANGACQSVALGERVALSTPGYNSQEECISLPALAAHSSYLLALTEQSWNSFIQIEIRDSAGSVLAARSSKPSDGAASIVWTPPAAGPYVAYLTNSNRFAKEASEYEFQVNQISGSREYRFDPGDMGLCGADNHIQLEASAVDADSVRLTVRKCDFENFTEGGSFWVLVDNVEQWGPFTYAKGVSSFNQTVQPAGSGLWGRHTYQVKTHPSNNASRAMHTGSVRIWDFYTERNIDWRDIDYTYYVAAPDTSCKGIIELRLRKTGHVLEARVRKCDRTAFSSSGEMWILANGSKRWGPFPYAEGDSTLYADLDPRGGYDVMSQETYAVWLYSNCDHAASGCNPDEAIVGGSVRATPYLQTVVSARKDGVVWSEVGVWKTSNSGSPIAQGTYTDYVPDGMGPWNYYFSKIPGYVVDESIYDAGVNFGESDTHYSVRIASGQKVALDYVLDCRKLTWHSNPLGGGRVDVFTPPNCGARGYLPGTTVELRAEPATGYTFSHWSGPLSGMPSSTTLVMDDDQRIAAHFNLPCYPLTLVAQPANGGAVQTATAQECAGGYLAGSLVTISAAPNLGFTFDSWSGAAAGAQNPLVLAITAGTVITAEFAALPDTPTPTATDTPTPTATSTPTPTATSTPTPTATSTPADTPTGTATLAAPHTATPTATSTPISTATTVAPETPTDTPTPTATATTPAGAGEDLFAASYDLWVSPQSPPQGVTTTLGLFIYRQGGHQPLTVMVHFYEGDPANGGVLLGSAEAPMLSANSSGSTAALAWTPDAAGMVELFAVIDPDNLIAESDETNNRLSRTVAVLPPQTDATAPEVTAFSVNGGAVGTTGRTVSLAVTAADGGASDSGVAGIYIVEYLFKLDVRAWTPVKTSGSWLAYNSTGAAAPDALSATYPWELTATPGLHSLQVWATDRAGNISLLPKRAFINYTPGNLSIGIGSVHVLRYQLNAGDQLRVRVQPISGDPDIYLWSPDALTLPRAPWYSNWGGVEVEQLSVVAPVSGSYQLEIIGYTAAELALDWQVTPAGLAGADEMETAGIDAQKPLRAAPVVPPGLMPGDQYSYMPPVANVRSFLYLPAVQR